MTITERVLNLLDEQLEHGVAVALPSKPKRHKAIVNIAQTTHSHAYGPTLWKLAMRASTAQDTVLYIDF